MEEVMLLVDHKGKNGVVPVKVTDILYLSYIKAYRKVAFYTNDATYYFMGSKEHWTEVLNNSGGNFMDVDRHNSVNIMKVRRTETKPYYAYFEKFRTVNELRCSMSARGYNELLEELSVGIKQHHKLVPSYQ
ncbi:LytTR family transcriptional regulator DNA-binding domain-containing protein [Paenibacillus xylanexedens]|uniref:LytTR family transcriptional regulator DNA-binding domain-containing protein n=1 Tax=Paenibacillus xylanexedens TaxID=528191 RepID=UPI001F019EB5|nr:LytTR family transcriptional regulator DNA-binding domain-containing protein [Paenibacillus xylanexedens]MCF7753394.1 LytTR family transcriptional regulator DNA-binding domain-containing protein [Paenibacillus xylanexedens]